ncbi:DUF697 domain-containing protein [Sutterella seckii]|uniref:DUF697 domain-containing protein n=1 Tax=Sutterella seckii TaxID=1944635 RepID=A0AAI9WM32_9BURK|nr:DUF697 domain-containing protein [Sutterella seckii]KAB7649477.1 DUF697 domain-containing protein [Sutterella seckii]
MTDKKTMKAAAVEGASEAVEKVETLEAPVPAAAEKPVEAEAPCCAEACEKAEAPCECECKCEEKAECCCDKARKIDEIIRKHVYGAVGVGLVPVPLLDVAGFMGVQLNMIRRMCEVYNLPFSEKVCRKVITTLVGGITPVALTPIAFSLLKVVPVVGYTASAASLAALGGGATYAVGRIYAKHFANGGTTENLEPSSVKEDFKKAYESGKGMVKEAVQKVKGESKAAPAEA